MFLNIESKKTGETICFDIKSYHFSEEFAPLFEYINNINEFKFNIINESED